uniref:Uncharacterized protein n=1 Tax=Anguilla anguilla TaxID=7936 RepID=A0A0E9VH89_ANGAN
MNVFTVCPGSCPGQGCPPSVPFASWSPRRRGRVWRRGHWGPPGGSANG